MFKTRWQNSEQLEFKVEKMNLLESLKSRVTKQLQINVEAAFLEEESIRFLDQNFKQHPGRTQVKVVVQDQISNMKVGLLSRQGIEMNEELSAFLMGHPEFLVIIDSAV
jgi:DNA polymerase-3 subunit alpha